LTRSTDQLGEYRAKRDFARTPEPSGRQTVKASGRLRYVIQKHAARRLHYDLRLELDGVFKSWAVTRGPSLNPADKRLAVEVEDHPLDYGDFEGTIPAGQYGGGTVQLWDRGYWEAAGGADPHQALAAGQLKFNLYGQRLQGQWALVRMRDEGKRTNWLLIKHRDAAADPARAEQLLSEDRSVASGRSMQEIAAGRGRAPKAFMLAGASARPDAVWQSNRNGADESGPAGVRSAATSARVAAAVPSKARATARRGTVQMPEFVEPELCKLVSRPSDAPGWVHEVKFDGYRVQLRVEAGNAVLRTRKGLDWSERFPQIRRAAGRLPDCLLDGEVVSVDAAGRPSFQALQSALAHQRTEQLVYFAFDLLFLQGEDLRAAPLAERKQRLQALLEDRQGPIRYVAHFQAPADTVLKSACRMALEGIVSKRLDAPYVSGRQGGWTKSKCRAGQEVVIGGWSSQDGELRSLLVGVHRDGRLVYAGRVGTGFTRDSARQLQSRLRKLASQDSPFTALPRQPGTVHWVRPQLVAEIEFAGWTDVGLVRQGAFKGLREDKPAAEIGVEVPVDTGSVLPAAPAVAATDESVSPASAADAEASPARRTRRTRAASQASSRPRRASVAAAAADRSGPPVVLGVTISQPDKPLWPATADGQAVTKLQLAQYLAAVGPWLIEHIRGRPCSLVRAPDGITGQHFMQRHGMPGLSSLVELAHVAGDRKPYVMIDRVEGLIAVAQIAALELHPWNCQPHQFDVPGRLVFDLDPAPDVSFDAVVDGALELRERLEALGLQVFCKTTGGKGLHVVTPLAVERSALDWAAAKRFAQAVCVQMAADSPQRYLTVMAKKERVGRIFLDYLRNDRMSTAVAPLSPRARAGAPVSMPLEWRQVRRGLDPTRYTVRTAPSLLERTRPWRDYDRGARPLREAIARFTAAATPAPRAAGARATRGTRARSGASA
jgi:bifunctional non-homologous end joining protein LigD